MGFSLSSSNSEAAGQPCKGFSLVEAAIVLAVVGFVLGGIWYAASQIRTNIQVQKVASDITLSVSKIRNMFHGLPLPGGMNFNLRTTPDAVEVSPNIWEIPIPWKHPASLNRYTIVIQLQGTSIRYYVNYPNKKVCLQLVRAVITNDRTASEMLNIGFCPSAIATGCTPAWTYLSISTAQQAYNAANTYCTDPTNTASVAFGFKP